MKQTTQKYTEPERLEIPDKKTKRRVLILSKPGVKSSLSGSDYLFVACGDAPDAKPRRYPERGIVVPFDRFFNAMNGLVEAEIAEWNKTPAGRALTNWNPKKKTRRNKTL